MSNSEDYLDGLLNSISKAKTDAINTEESAKSRQKARMERRRQVSYDDDFMDATGLSSFNSDIFNSKSNSDSDFWNDVDSNFGKSFEDDFIAKFEAEIDEDERRFQETGELSESHKIVDSLLLDDEEDASVALNKFNDNKSKALDDEAGSADDSEYNELINPENAEDSLWEDTSDNLESQVSDEGDKNLEDLDISGFDESNENRDEEESIDDDSAYDIDKDDLNLKSIFEESSSDDSDSSDESAPDEDDVFDILSEESEVEEEPLNLDEEESSNDVMDEFAPDDMDAKDAMDFNDSETDSDEPDLSLGGDLDIGNILDDNDDLMDIGSIIDGEDELDDIDESVEDDEADTADNDSETDKKAKKKGKKEKKEKGPKKPNPIIEKLLLIIFGPPDEDELEEMRAAEEAKKKKAEKSAEGEENTEGGEEEGKKGKKKKEKKEKPPKEPKEKKEKPKKEPKPKKPKKEKEPDNSPKIPISIIIVFLALSISIIGIVIVGMDYMGIQRHMNQAVELYEAGDYIAAYEKLNGLDLSDEDDVLMRNRARTLADLQQCQDEYEVFIEEEMYDFALDSLIKGIGRYEKYKDDAEDYGIADEYNAYEEQFISEINSNFGLSKEDALAIFNQENRHYYTVELRKVLIRLGLEE